MPTIIDGKTTAKNLRERTCGVRPNSSRRRASCPGWPSF